MTTYIVDVKCIVTKTVLVEAESKSEARTIAMDSSIVSENVTHWEFDRNVSAGPAREDKGSN